jgi:hypothetical protein
LVKIYQNLIDQVITSSSLTTIIIIKKKETKGNMNLYKFQIKKTFI